MRLLKIGRDASCDLVLHSDKVSSLHAEMTVLNTGDILLEDKNSRNGTFLMNKPIKAGTTVSVRRGDAIRFGDVELMWSQIPMPENNSNYKALFGIGTNFRNEIQISGNTVSRFHATLKIGKDGKAYIQDHSKNGTTVNGTRAVFGQNVRIKRSDAIACGGVPVDLKPFMPGAHILMKIIATVAVAAVIVGIVFGVRSVIGFGKPSIKALETATTCVVGNYYIVATFEDDPFIELLEKADWPKEWLFGRCGKDYPVLKTWTVNDDDVTPIGYTGTAFFISKEGELGTNRHIATPWNYIDDSTLGMTNKIKQTLAEYRNELLPINELKTYNHVTELKTTWLSRDNKHPYRGLLGEIIYEYLFENGGGFTEQKLNEVNGWISRFKSSPIKISGRIESIDIALKGQNLTYTRELLPCHVVAESGNKEKDVALLRLNSKKTPENIIKEGFFDIKNARVDEKKLQPQQEDLITIGYPYGLLLGLQTENKTVKPTVHKISVSKEPDENKFQFQGEELGGASGSPIVDEKEHRLVGVLYGGYTVGATFGLACNIKHLKELYDKNRAKDDE